MDLVDADSLGRWLDTQGLEPGQPLVVAPLTGGSSNAMFVVDRGQSRWVLRRPTRVAVERANEGMRREFRILAALAGTDVPHPEVVALCEDHDVLGCTFYLMERVQGVNPFPLPAVFDSEQGRAEVAYSMVEALGRLHNVDWLTAGIGDLGHPEGFHERQVQRWSRQLASYEGRELPGIETVMAWIEAHLPEDSTATIMHGDYHMLNVLIAAGTAWSGGGHPRLGDGDHRRPLVGLGRLLGGLDSGGQRRVAQPGRVGRALQIGARDRGAR